jgi:protocatechuate 4,5-dioxygenase, alpha chain
MVSDTERSIARRVLIRRRRTLGIRNHVFAAANAAVSARPGASYDACVSVSREYDDIPGTFVFDGRRSREGYWLNMFCMSLRDEENRQAFRADEQGYLDRFELTPEQREAVLTRDWLRMLELGGNIYYTFKLAACDGMTFQQLAAKQTGVSEEEYVGMMLGGGRGIEGNRSTTDTTREASDG